VSRRLKPEELRAPCDPAGFSFRSTAELTPFEGLIGQERAVEATAFGIGMRHRGYNLFVLGPAATGKTTSMRRLLDVTAAAEATPSDWCYVHNFADPYRPSALELPAGRGRVLGDEMLRLVGECKMRLPRLFESEEFQRQKSRILEDLAQRQEREVTPLEDAARASGFVLLRTPSGLALSPAPAGQPLTHEEFHALPEAAQRRLQELGRPLEERLETVLRQLRHHERDAQQRHAELVRQVATAGTRVPGVASLAQAHQARGPIAPAMAWAHHSMS